MTQQPSMRAAFYRRYGPPEVLAVTERPRPEPGRGEIRLRLRASTVTSADARIRGFRTPAFFWLPMRLMLGITGPRHRIPGMEFAGEVDALGPGASRFRAGEAVFGIASHGAHAQYLVLPDSAVMAPLPPGLSLEEAAALPFGGLTALVFLRDLAALRPGEAVLVVGATGAVGVAAVQIAHHMGARVDAACGGGGFALVRDLGAERAFDLRHGDPPAGRRYDVIIDTVGALPFARSRAWLAPAGRHLALCFGGIELAAAWASRWRRGPRLICGMSGTAQADLEAIATLARCGALRPVIGRRHDLAEIVAAHRHVDGGHKRGSLVLRLP